MYILLIQIVIIHKDDAYKWLTQIAVFNWNPLNKAMIRHFCTIKIFEQRVSLRTLWKAWLYSQHDDKVAGEIMQGCVRFLHRPREHCSFSSQFWVHHARCSVVDGGKTPDRERAEQCLIYSVHCVMAENSTGVVGINRFESPLSPPRLLQVIRLSVLRIYWKFVPCFRFVHFIILTYLYRSYKSLSVYCGCSS